MTQPLPTLSTTGWVKYPSQIIDNLFAYFFVADYSQTNAHKGRIASLPYLIKVHSNSPQTLAGAIESALTNLFDSYFEQVNISISVSENTQNLESYDIKIMGTVVDNKRTYDIARLAMTTNNKLMKTSNLSIN